MVLTRDLTQAKPVLIQLRKKAANLPGVLPYESDGDVRRKIKIKPLIETNVGVAQA